MAPENQSCYGTVVCHVLSQLELQYNKRKLEELLKKVERPCASSHHSTSDKTSRGRCQSVQVTSNGSTFQEMNGCFEAHLLQGGAIRLHTNTIKWLILSIVGHVIRNQ